MLLVAVRQSEFTCCCCCLTPGCREERIEASGPLGSAVTTNPHLDQAGHRAGGGGGGQAGTWMLQCQQQQQQQRDHCVVAPGAVGCVYITAAVSLAVLDGHMREPARHSLVDAQLWGCWWCSA